MKKDSKDAPTIPSPASPSYFYHLHFCIVKTLLLQEVLYTPNQVVEDGSGSFSLNHFPKGGRWYRLKDPKWKNHLLWLCVTIIRKFVSYDTYLAVTLPHKYYTDRARGQATHHYSHCSRCFSFSLKSITYMYKGSSISAIFGSRKMFEWIWKSSSYANFVSMTICVKTIFQVKWISSKNHSKIYFTQILKFLY